MIQIKEKSGETALLATFQVREALFALEATKVQEVIRVANLTAVAHAPEEVSGILNLRGRIVTVIDTGFRLGFGRTEPQKDSRIFILDDRNEYIGLLVDRAGDVMECSGSQLEPAPANVPAQQARYLQGVFRNGERVVAVVDAMSLLDAGGTGDLPGAVRT
jgi:purine-binding chemotaxis protein CheW